MKETLIKFFKKVFQRKNIKHVVWIAFYVVIFIYLSKIGGSIGSILALLLSILIVVHLLVMVGIVSTSVNFSVNKKYVDSWKLYLYIPKLFRGNVHEVIYTFKCEPSPDYIKAILLQHQGLYLDVDDLDKIVKAIQAGKKYRGVDAHDIMFSIKLEKTELSD